jgi:O-antigen/teichoic acid export membrane protein
MMSRVSSAGGEQPASNVSLRGLARSSMYVNAAQGWQVASRLVLTPVVIARLGLDGYGAWALVFSLCANAIALDAGAGWAYAKLTAEFDERADFSRLSEVLSSGLLLVGSTVALGLTAVWLAHAWILPILGVPPELLHETERTLLVLSLAVVFKASLGGVLPVLAGLQRMDLQYRYIICGSVVEFATALTFLLVGLGMAALPIGVLAGEVVAISAAWRACRRLRPALHLSPLRASAAGVRQVVELGVRFQSLVLLATTARQGIRLMISSLYGTAALGIFNLADRLLSVAGSPALAIISPLMPAFARLSSGPHAWRWRRLFSRASKALAVAAALPLLFAAVFADPILFAWTGRHFPDAAWTARVLAPVEFLTLLTGVAGARLRAAGTVRLELTAGLAGSLLALAGLAAAYPLAGFAGSMVAVACARSAGAAWLLERFASFGQLDRWLYVRTIVLAPVLRFAPICGALGTALFVLPVFTSADASRWAVLGTLTLLAGAYALACAPVAWFLELSASERARVTRLVRRKRRVARGRMMLPASPDRAPLR